MIRATIVFLLALLWCGKFAFAQTSPNFWSLYDGNGVTPLGYMETQAGVSCGFYNTAGFLRWQNKGGDWVDRFETPQGTVPFSSAPYAEGIDRLQVVNLNVTELLRRGDGIILRRNGPRVIKLASRESTTPPVLQLTLADGTTQTRKPTADASLLFALPKVCQTTPTGKSKAMSLGHSVVLAFQGIPKEQIVSARLTVTVITAYSSGTLQAYRMVAPRTDGTPKTAISTNPGVYYYESWEDDNWWQRTGGTQRPSAQWTQDEGRFSKPSQNGLWYADGSDDMVSAQGTDGLVQVSRGNGAKGRGLMIVYHPDLLAYGVSMGNVVMSKVVDGVAGGPEPDEAWLTYSIKFGKNFKDFHRCEGGKLPGLSGSTQYCAGSAVAANGYCGWSLRQSYRLICDPQNPAYNHVLIHTYAYHGLMPGFYGQGWFGGEHALLALDKWHCVEQRVKVNTPGLLDGINQVYVNGKLAIDKTDVYLRAVKPEPEGYGDWRRIYYWSVPKPGARIIKDPFGRSFWFHGSTLAGSNLGINKAYMVVHNGGMNAPRRSAQLWLDEVKVSHRRVGCN